MTTRKNTWHTQEIRGLTTLYFMGATDTEISKVLKRTPQSINKKINRLKLRLKNTSTHIVKPGRYIPAFGTQHDILKSMQHILQNVDTEEPHQYLLSKYPPKKIRKVHKICQEKLGAEDNGQWRTLKEIIEFLRNHRQSIASLQKPSQYTASYTHILNGKAVGTLQLLVEANKIQHALGECPFYLENLTEA
tara:strand:- start:1858 stop:2430 length:573 start_codon:yes stop_codon:yes gene_type:complete